MTGLFVNHRITIPENELEESFIRSSGPGGQNVNKVSSAVHLRFDIGRSSLPPAVKHTLMALQDQRVTRDGVIVIKAQTSRSRTRNRAEALARLHALVAEAAHVQPLRRATQPTRASRLRRLESKALRSSLKSARDKPQI